MGQAPNMKLSGDTFFYFLGNTFGHLSIPSKQ